MADLRTLIRDQMERGGSPSYSFDDLGRRRDRKRRNQRITAAVVGIAVFVAAVLIVTSGASFDRTRTPAAPGPTETGPPASTDISGRLEALAGPEGVPEWVYDPSLSRVNLITLPPKGAPPTSPEDGELVFELSGRGEAAGRALSHMWVYEDGRLIWWREGVPPEGMIFEQRLTPGGVELLRSEVISSGLFDNGDFIFTDGGADPDPLAFEGSFYLNDGDRLVGVFPSWQYWPGDATSDPDPMATAEQERALELLDARLADPASWLPESAWADQELRAYVPSRYAVCYGGGPIAEHPTVERDRILDGLPAPARELLRAAETKHRFVDGGGPHSGRTFYCSAVTTEEARLLVQAVGDAGLERQQYRADPLHAGSVAATFEYDFSIPDPIEEATIRIDPYLPHVGAECIPCG